MVVETLAMCQWVELVVLYPQRSYVSAPADDDIWLRPMKYISVPSRMKGDAYSPVNLNAPSQTLKYTTEVQKSPSAQAVSLLES